MSGFDYGKTRPDGQHERHPSLPPDLPLKQIVRFNYIHNTCMGTTRMPAHCAQTYAQNPKYYGRTFCCICGGYFPVSEFVWPDTGTPINEPVNDGKESSHGTHEPDSKRPPEAGGGQ